MVSPSSSDSLVRFIYNATELFSCLISQWQGKAGQVSFVGGGGGYLLQRTIREALTKGVPFSGWSYVKRGGTAHEKLSLRY